MVVLRCLKPSTASERARARDASSPSVLRSAAESVELPSGELTVVESITLVQALETVPDPRNRRGRRHSLRAILLLALGAVMAGARSYVAIAD